MKNEGRASEQMDFTGWQTVPDQGKLKTLKFVGLAPIFDSGNSMFWNRLVPKKV